MLSIEPSIGRGNIKLGPIPSFSLPSRFSCPGATSWCLEHCYAARYEHIRSNCRRAYARNLVLSWDSERFVHLMLKRIDPQMPFLRIHVSGDFHSSQYADAWYRIAKARPHTQLWAYTRSWTVASIRPALERFRNLKNVNLFASTDPGMPDPPSGWRIAYLDIDPRAKGLPCPHQFGTMPSCYECQYCFRPGKGNVIFKIH